MFRLTNSSQKRRATSQRENRNHLRGSIRLEPLELRQMMAADLNFFDSTLPQIPQEDAQTAEVKTSKPAASSQLRQSEAWFADLSIAVQSSIHAHQNLKNFTNEQLKQASSWAVVVEQSDVAEKQLAELSIVSIQDRSDLFRGRVSARILEVRLKDSGNYAELLGRMQIGRDGVLAVIPQFKHRAEATGTLDPATVTDNLFAAQWHLDATANNTQYGVNAEGAWAQSTGENVRVAIVDTRQDLAHPDLAANLNAAISYDDADLDWNGDGIGDNNPNVFLAGGSPNWPRIPDTDTTGDGILDSDLLQQQSHGTAVAGLAVGDDDGSGTVGIAPDATYAAFNFLESPDQSIPDTFSWQNISNIDVFNNSWGSSNTRQLIYASFIELQAIENAAVDSIFVKSAGNDRDILDGFQGWDRSNYDSRHLRQVIVVGATQQNGQIEDYSNPGSNVLVTAPVNRTGSPVNTLTSDVTDPAGSNADNRGYLDGNTTAGFNGTSAAAPIVSGTIALMLEVNPSLSWRDVQHILIDTAQLNGVIDVDGDGVMDGVDSDADGIIDNLNLRTTFSAAVDTNGDGIVDGTLDTDADGSTDPYHTGWFENAGGNWVSDSFGFGIVDAAAATQLAKEWGGLPEEKRLASLKQVPSFAEVPEGTLGGLDSVSSIDSFDAESHMSVEWVEVTVNAEAPDQDELMLVLKSPNGTQSILMAPGGQTGNSDISNFTFTTNQFWDESADGEWTLQALDTGVGDGQAIKILDWQISIYGSSDAVSPLEVTPLGEADVSLEDFASLVMTAGGVEKEGYEFNSVRQVGNSYAMGIFENGGESDLPMDSGLLFTTGKAVDAIGPNDSEHTTTDWDSGGHQLLDDLTGAPTKDASGLEIYFTATKSGWISFEAIFGSEEFDEWVGSKYNDGAGIFITELKSEMMEYKSGVPTNVLRTPSSSDLTVNKLATKAPDGSVNGKYYDPNPAFGDMNWEYDGSSPVVKSTETWLSAGHHYFVGVLIGDAVDGAYDSGLAISLDSAIGRDRSPLEALKSGAAAKLDADSNRYLETWFSKSSIDERDIDQLAVNVSLVKQQQSWKAQAAATSYKPSPVAQQRMIAEAEAIDSIFESFGSDSDDMAKELGVRMPTGKLLSGE